MFEHVVRTLHNFGLRPDVAQSEDQASKTLPIMMYVPIVIIPCPPDSFGDAGTDAATDASNIANCSDEISDLCEECTGHLVVRSTFLHMDDGHSLMQTYRKLRRAKSDFALMNDPEVYEPGKLSPANFRETHQQTQTMQAPHFQPLQPLQPVSDVHPCNGRLRKLRLAKAKNGPL